ncbi:MAG TPA: pyridoxamine 5'-phosphate oxidase family protein [Acidimicrobiales bacterium]
MVDRNGLEVLSRQECLRLLASRSIGRIAVTSQALPVILPVNFLIDGDRILIRTTPGTKLYSATAGAVVGFEVDDFEGLGHSGWSVSVTGLASVVTDEHELARIGRLPLARWARSGDEHVIAITTEIVSGRRLPYGLARAKSGDYAGSGTRQ